MTRRVTRDCKAVTLALIVASMRQVLDWMCRRVLRYILGVSCKYTCPSQHECPSLFEKQWETGLNVPSVR